MRKPHLPGKLCKNGARLAALAILMAAVSYPGAVSAQAVCSAPHSSPTLANSGSLRTLPVGGGWIQGAVFGQQADRFFNPSGSRQPFLADSKFTTQSIFLTGAVGIATGLELWAQLPAHRLRVKSAGGNSRSSGVGDVRFAARIGSEIVGLDIPIAARFGVKLPGSKFPVDATILPLTEGQRDWEVALESGYGFPNRSIYLMGWMGYRWREIHEEASRDPGDEAFGHLAVGGALGGISWELAGDGLWGKAPVALGFTIPGESRRLIQLQPTLGLDAGPGRVEASAQIPLMGQNLPVGTGFILGYRMTWGLLPNPAATLENFLGG